jgi:hypothetical protein
MRSLVFFICGALLFGTLTLGIGYWVGNDDTLLQGGVAFGLAFVPAALTLGLVVYSYRSTPELQLTASLGGSGLRMAVALGGGVFLTNTQPHLFGTPFWSWLVLFYLVLLGFEITLLVWRTRSPQASG